MVACLSAEDPRACFGPGDRVEFAVRVSCEPTLGFDYPSVFDLTGGNIGDAVEQPDLEVGAVLLTKLEGFIEQA
jgi:hypothetical protein